MLSDSYGNELGYDIGSVVNIEGNKYVVQDFRYSYDSDSGVDEVLVNNCWMPAP